MITKGDKINNRYQIIKTIGEGGMANVYLANDTILNRQVAVKILRGDLADDEKFVRRFQREALSASKLAHPNIVEVYDVGEENGYYYIVMEYINGKTLKNLIKRRGSLTLPEVIDIMTQLTNAVICAHDSYIIHRDIKPQNIMILEDGTVKITDFGIATSLNSIELTQTNSIMGSVHYLPPEQATGSAPTIKSDIYSLGILMFELLTGKVPFKGDTAVEIAIKQMKEPIPSVIELKPDIPQSVENIIITACAKNLKNRYENAKTMLDDLKNALSEDGLKQLKVTHKYNEHENEEKKPVIEKKEPVKEVVKKEVKEVNEVKKPLKKSKIKDKILWITGSILAVFIAIICLVIIIYPQFTEVASVIVPDVSNLTVLEAEAILKEHGLSVKAEIEEKADDEVETGKVIKTSPQTGRTVKEGAEITLVVAIESGKVQIEDYSNTNYLTVEAKLNNLDLNVILEPKKIAKEEQSKYKEFNVVEQSAQPGEKLEKGDTIVIYYAVFVTEYPDFTVGHNLDSVLQFCDENNLILEIKYQETDAYEDGTIINQSRTGEVIENSTLIVTIAKAKEQESPETPEEPTE